jgi:hypothetical protein
MDLSIFYRIFYKPSSVFKQFVEKRRYEPIILALLVSCFLNIYAYAGDFDTILRQPILLLLAFFQTSIGLFAFPLTIAIYVFLIGRLFKTNITLISVISISLLSNNNRVKPSNFIKGLKERDRQE